MTLDSTLAALREAMSARYGTTPNDVRFVQAPYRICPLGAHIDHQLGTVTAMAVQVATHLAFAPMESGEVRLRSLIYPGEVRFRLDEIPPRQPGDWGNYARGAAWALSRSHKLSRGLVGVTSGQLAEVGLSSSASIGLAYLLALEHLNGLTLTPAQNIRLDQAIENEYLGLRNGILDQSAILLSRRDHLTVIDCKAFAEFHLETSPHALPPGMQLIPQSPSLPRFALLIAFSGLTKAVLSTDYNRRVEECAEAARLLLQAAGRPGAPHRLAEVTEEEFHAHRSALSASLARRAEHFFSETNRVRQGLTAWREGDLAGFGRLISESGASSIRNYECGSPPLIDLYEILARTAGVLGARFSGAGFRGCCLAVVEPASLERIVPEVQSAYAARHPELASAARFLVCESGDGARIL